jgi:ADP-dependent NAD(P)H-hydrate dehydratase
VTIPIIDAHFLRSMPLPQPKEGDKNDRGNVLILAGSRDVPGAALLCGEAALRSGAGRLQIATVAPNARMLGLLLPEALVLGLTESQHGGIEPDSFFQIVPYLKRADSVLLGPGMQDAEAVRKLAGQLVAGAGPSLSIVLDASAIPELRKSEIAIKSLRGQSVITPHAGELAGLMRLEREEIESDPLAFAHRAARDFGVVVAMKGAATFVVSPDDRTCVCREGNVGLATSGSGDVLAGLIAGLLARGATPFSATCWGVYIHAQAGDRLSHKVGPLGFLARELLPEIPPIMGELSDLKMPGRRRD